MSASYANNSSPLVSNTSRDEMRSALLDSAHTLASYLSKFADWPYQTPILAFPRNGYADFELFTAKDINSLGDRVAGYLVSQGLEQLAEEDSITVTIMARASAFFFATMVALAKLGYTIFLLSPQLSVPTTAALLVKTNCSIVLHSPDMASKVEEVKILHSVRNVRMISRAELGNTISEAKPVIYDTDRWTRSSKIGFIWQSSGSTGIPKIFLMGQEAIMSRLRSTSRSQYAGISHFITSAVYNSAGSTFAFTAVASSSTTYFYNDRLPYTADGLTQVLIYARPDLATIFPSGLEQLASTPAGLEALKACKSVSAFGAVCATQLGNRLVDEGINLNSQYATSETSILMTSASRDTATDKAWDFLTPYPFTKKHIWLKPLANGVYECVILSGLANCPTSNSDDPPGSFHTGDIFTKHPSLPDRWKLLCRADDLISMSFLETFVALPFESQIKQHPLVEEAVVFGNGRPKLGVLVFWSEKAKGLIEDELIAQLWPLMKELNAENQAWARISKDMTISIPLGEKWPKTDKQNLIRPQVYRQYEGLINAKYDQLDEASIKKSHEV